MPKYLFSNDQRISALVERIQWVANYVLSGKNLKDIPDKSDNNNAATLEFYYNLYPNTENTKMAITSPKEVIRNFVLKFQFPNPRTPESFYSALSEHVLLAPYRITISLLVALAKSEDAEFSFLTLEEILYYEFADSKVYGNPAVNCNKLARRILENRKKSIDFSAFISANVKWNQYDRQVREMMAVLCKCFDGFQLSKGNLKYTRNVEDEDVIEQIINYNYFWIPSNKDNFSLSNKEYISYMNLADTPYNVVDFSQCKENDTKYAPINSKFALQQIYYGAPGTGKSHAVREVSEQYPDTIRTTFHPDSDYASFVGAYKPTVAMEKLYDEAGVPVKVVDQELFKNQITYKFVKQAFLKAYVNAWKKFTEAKDASDIKCQFLVIEEINRGNCAQIFGDLFQLLDRKNGFSEYPIEADEDIAKSLLEEETPENPSFGKDGLKLGGWQKEYIENLFQKSKDKDVIVEKISKGRVLVLPCNLYIWATMNTSDQSLFPIDSAFKRRWDWKYVPINTEVKKWAIEVDGQKYSWTSFLNKINDQIFSVTHSEDKKFGFFFCHADKKSDESVEEEDVISAERFVSKVIFFVYNDVFKDYGFDRKMFQDEDGKAIQFHEYYRMDGSVDESKVKRFLDNLEVCTLS